MSSVDYPVYGQAVSEKVASGDADLGILICGTGLGMSYVANKVKGIRAATCYNEFSARSAREHNNANIIVMGAKTLGEETIKSILDTFLNSDFLGDRHQKRLDKISKLEKE